jgi:hypothetical protein
MMLFACFTRIDCESCVFSVIYFKKTSRARSSSARGEPVFVNRIAPGPADPATPRLMYSSAFLRLVQPLPATAFRIRTSTRLRADIVFA